MRIEKPGYYKRMQEDFQAGWEACEKQGMNIVEAVKLQRDSALMKLEVERQKLATAVEALKSARNESSWPLVKAILDKTLRELGEL